MQRNSEQYFLHSQSSRLLHRYRIKIIPYKQLYLFSCFYLYTVSQTLSQHGIRISLEASPTKFAWQSISSWSGNESRLSIACFPPRKLALIIRFPVVTVLHLSLMSLPPLPSDSRLPVKVWLECRLFCILNRSPSNCPGWVMVDWKFPRHRPFLFFIFFEKYNI